MVKEIRNYANFRQKFCIAVACIAAVMFLLHVYSVSRTSTHGDLLNVPHQKHNVKISPLIDLTDGHLDISYVEENLGQLAQTDPQLISYTRIRHLTPPSKLEYNFEGQGTFRDHFSGWVADFFKDMRDGIFIEAGAHEGEKGSHTLYLEKELGWTGLLVECNPTVVPYLRSHHRKAWIADVCLAPTENAATLNFSNPTNWTYSGTLRKPWNLPVPSQWTSFDVQAIPFYTILAALGWSEVDFFSFDIEGQELSVFKTFPFDLVTFKLLIVEIMFYTEEEKVELDELLQSKGYIFVQKLEVDRIYVHNSFKHMIP